MKKCLNSALDLLKQSGFANSTSDSKLLVRQVGEQLHGVYFLCTDLELRIRIQFHYTFLESLYLRGANEISVPISEFEAIDFALHAEVADFERPVGNHGWWSAYDYKAVVTDEWNSSFIAEKSEIAIDQLNLAAQRWKDPRVIMDALTPRSFEFRVHRIGDDVPDSEQACVANWLLAPWGARQLQLCCLAASIAHRYGYTAHLVPQYENVYKDMLAVYEAAGAGPRSPSKLIRVRGSD